MTNTILSTDKTNSSDINGLAPRIDAATRLGAVSYTVADLERQIAFYQEVLGFKLHWRGGNQAALGAGKEGLLQLTEVRGAKRVRGTTGLYHTAFLVPSRWELANLLKRIAETRSPVEGMSDHYTHLAIYLPDAEGNGIELAWDFPRDKWEFFVEELRTKGPGIARQYGGRLNVEELLSELEQDPTEWTGVAGDTRIGHVHLHVADLAATRQFYHNVLGFDITMDSEEMGGTFFSAGGYHHHIGTNVWNGRGAPRPPADARGLRHFSIVLPNASELERLTERIAQQGVTTETTEQGLLVRDPAGNGVLLTTEPAK